MIAHRRNPGFSGLKALVLQNFKLFGTSFAENFTFFCSELDKFYEIPTIHTPARWNRADIVFMKSNLHPNYNPVVFVDMTTGARVVTRSTKTSDRKEEIDGVEHYVITVGITSDSHPFFTGQKQFVDTEGRIDKFQKRFGASVRRAAKPKL